MMKTLLCLTIIIINFNTTALADIEDATPVITKPSILKMSVGPEVYFFKFEDKISDYKPTGRKTKLEYKYKAVQTTNISAAITLFKSVTLAGSYGDSKLSFTQDHSRTENPPQNAPSWMSKESNSLFGVSLQMLGLKILHSQYKFSSGQVNVRDVSADPTGEQGPKIASFNNNLEFKDSEISYGVGGIYNWFAKSEKEKKRSDFIKYFLVPFRIGYIYNEASLPIIPYFFYKQAGQVMFEEGKIQKAVVKNSMVGFGWDWKYADLFYYLGSSRIQLTDQDDVKRNLKTNGNITKFRLRYEWEIEDKYVDYTIGPYFQMTYYDFNDDQVGKSTSVGGDFFIYKLGLNLGFKI